MTGRVTVVGPYDIILHAHTHARPHLLRQQIDRVRVNECPIFGCAYAGYACVPVCEDVSVCARTMEGRYSRWARTTLDLCVRSLVYVCVFVYELGELASLWFCKLNWLCARLCVYVCVCSFDRHRQTQFVEGVPRPPVLKDRVRKLNHLQRVACGFEYIFPVIPPDPIGRDVCVIR